MSKIEDRLADYRSLRDASKKVLLDDIEHARVTYSVEAVTNRYLGGVIEGTKDVYEVAKVHTVEHRGIIAIALGALALWHWRKPLLEAMEEDKETDAESSEAAHSPSEMSTEELSFGDSDDN